MTYDPARQTLRHTLLMSKLDTIIDLLKQITTYQCKIAFSTNTSQITDEEMEKLLKG